MKFYIKIIIIIPFILIGTIAILIVDTITYKFNKPPINENNEVINTIPSEKAVLRFVGGIRIPTIVNNNVYEETDFKTFDDFIKYLPSVYPEVYRTLEVDTINKYDLIFRWKGKNNDLKPVLFLSHYDVTPVIGYDFQTILYDETTFCFDDNPLPPANYIADKWDYPPFSGAVANGRIYGRGTLDMKSMLFSLMESIDTLIAEGFQPERDVWLAFWHDEKAKGCQGTFKIANHFKKMGLSFEAIYDKGGFITGPGTIIKSVERPLALIGTGEKGFLTLKIRVKDPRNNSSSLPNKTSLGHAAEIIDKLSDNQMQARIIPPITTFLKDIGSEMDFIYRMVIANRCLLKTLLVNMFEKSIVSNAWVRTNTDITLEKDDEFYNNLSSVTEITTNFNILQGDSVAGVIDHVKKICKGYDVELVVESAWEPSSISSENVRGFEIMKDNLAKIYPEVIVSSCIARGGTDAYKYQIVSDNIYRFIPVYLNSFEQHAIKSYNEYISLENFGKMLWYFKELINSY